MKNRYCAPAKLHAWLSRVVQPALAALLLLFNLAAEGQTGLGPNERPSRVVPPATGLGPNQRPSRVIPPALAALLLFSLAAEGQAGLSGPALEGPLTITDLNGTQATFDFAGLCKGKLAPFNNTLPINFVVNGATVASLEGLPLPGKGPAGCLSQQGGEDLTVVTVVVPQFFNGGDKITAHVVILYGVVP